MGLSHLLRRLHAKARAVVNRAVRSPRWRHVEKAHLLVEPTCLGCGSAKHLQVHHVRPFHLDASLELDPTNLITACMDVAECHLRIAHGDSFKAYNPKVREHLEQSIGRPALRENVWEQAKLERLFV